MTKMTYTFDINQLHLLNTLIFDSSIKSSILESKLNNGSVEYSIERRTFENVTREKSLLGTKTKYNGKNSIIKFSGINSISIFKGNRIFKDNYFIQNIKPNLEKNVVELSTSFGIIAEFNVFDLFCAELIDLKNSEFGKGTSYGKQGFTNEEWNEYLKKEKYSL